MNFATSILIPDEIRFECTFCGNCCLAWPVPVTDPDIARIKGHLFESGRSSELPLSTISTREAASTKVFTHALSKRRDGRCSFLSDEELCELHDFAKPSMCRLFPYTFFASPEGFRVGLSFASTGVLKNSGRLLSAQKESLVELCGLFASLYGELAVLPEAPACVNLCHEFALEYEQFLAVEKALHSDLLSALREGTQSRSVLSILAAHSAQALGRLSASLPVTALVGESIDWYLLETYTQAFFGLGSELSLLQEDDLIGRMTEHVARSASGADDLALNLTLYEKHLSGPQSIKSKLVLPFSVENLLLRFVYVRVFSRLYFGPGFSSLSYIAGLGHLALLVAIIRLSLYAFVDSLKGGFFDQEDEILQEAMRLLAIVDRKWTALSYSRNGQSMLELLFLDRERLARLRDLL